MKIRPLWRDLFYAGGDSEEIRNRFSKYLKNAMPLRRSNSDSPWCPMFIISDISLSFGKKYSIGFLMYFPES